MAASCGSPPLSPSITQAEMRRKSLPGHFITLRRLPPHSSAQMFLRTYSHGAALIKLTASLSIPSFLNYFSAFSADPLSLDSEDYHEGKVQHVTEWGHVRLARQMQAPQRLGLNPSQGPGVIG